jgi:hypothetical protein
MKKIKISLFLLGVIILLISIICASGIDKTYQGISYNFSKLDKKVINDFSADTLCTENIKTVCRTDCLDWSINRTTNKTYCSGGQGSTCKNITLSKSCVKTLYSGVQYYHNGSEFLLINSTVTEKDCDYDYCVRAGVYKADFKIDSSSKENLVKFYYNGTYITFKPLGLYYSGLGIESLISNGNKVNGYPINETFYYPGLYGDGLDLKYSYYNVVLKEGLVIKENNLPEPSKLLGDNPTLSLKFIMKDNGKIYEKDNKLIDQSKYVEIESSDVKIKNVLNKDVFNLITPYAIDSNGSKIKLNYTLNSEGNNLIVSIETPYSWLKYAVYPVEIDPSVSLGSPYLIDDSYTAIGSPNTSLGNLDDSAITVGVQRTKGVIDKSWVKFDISSNLSNIKTGTIRGYNLTLYLASYWQPGGLCTQGGPSDAIWENFTIFLGNSSWREKNITWNNSPPINASVNSSTKYNYQQITSSFGEKDFNVTDIVNKNPDTGNLTFVVSAIDIGFQGLYDCSETVSFGTKDNLNPRGAKLKIIYDETYNLTNCADLNVNGMNYYLENDILNSQIDKCILITDSNIKLDCQGHRIESDGGTTDYGIYIEPYLTNITIFNCSVDKWDSASVYGNSTNQLNLSYCNISAKTDALSNAYASTILTDMNNSIIENNIFHNLLGFYQEGISFSGDNSNITNNIAYLTTYGVSFFGDNNIISNNFIYNTYDLYGLSVQGDSCTIYNNTIYNTTGEGGDSLGLSLVLSNSSIYNNNISGGYTGIILYGSYNNIFNNTIDDFVDNLIYIHGFYNSTKNSIYENNLNCNGSTSAIFLATSSGHGNNTNNIFYNMNVLGNCNTSIWMNDGANTTFLNVTYSAPTNITGGEILRKWYLSSQVNDTLGNPLNVINITGYYSNSNFDNSSLTDSNGFLILSLTEYTENSSGKTYLTPTTVNLTSNYYYTNSTIFNITTLQNIYQQFILENDTTPPLISIWGLLTSAGSRNFYFNVTANDAKLKSCKYYILNSTNGVDGFANISFTCNNNPIAAVTSDFGSYSLIVYSNDTSGNENSSTISFNVSQSSYFSPTSSSKTVTQFVNVTKTHCGDLICQHPNDMGVDENYWNCQQDCPGQINENLDTLVAGISVYCWDKNTDGTPKTETVCLWSTMFSTVQDINATAQSLTPAINLDTLILNCFSKDKNNTDKQCYWDSSTSIIVIFLALIIVFVFLTIKVPSGEGKKVGLPKYFVTKLKKKRK